MNNISTVETDKRELVWSDEFDYEGLPDPSKWGYEEGFVRNDELQYYTKARKENAQVENGMLVIEARKERFKNSGTDGPVADYTSASLITLIKASWCYGRIEVRAKLPQGNGVWPAIWTLGENVSEVGWPGCGEIDILEFLGRKPVSLFGAVHYGLKDDHKSSGKWHTTPRPFDDFHIYSVEWSPNRIDFFFDDKEFHTFRVGKAGVGDENPFRKPHYLLINLALGGWGGPVEDANLPQRYLIDYVRVYK